jgi:dTDP-glucose 4,6-dehydratase
MRILFTGGTGFFGKAVLRHLLELSADARRSLVTSVTVLSRHPDRFLRDHPEFAALDWLTFHRGDVEHIKSLPASGEYTHLLHAAADSTNVLHLQPWQRYEQIVRGTGNMLEFAAKRGIRRFLLASSGGVYGPQPEHLDAIPETYNGMPDPLCAANAYGVAKRQAEHLCALYAERFGIEPVVARCFAFVGEDLPLDVHFAIGNFLRDSLFADKIVVRGDGTPVRSYMDQYELARWLIALLARGAPGCAYNVGSPEPIAMGELAHLVSDVLGTGKPVTILAASNADNAQRHRYVPDVSRARTELQLVNKIGLARAIERAGRAISVRAQRRTPSAMGVGSNA